MAADDGGEKGYHPDRVKRGEKGRWVKGTCGGPGRKPGRRTLADRLWQILDEVPTGDELAAMFEALEVPPGLQAQIEMAEDRQEAFARVLAYRALTGSWAAIEQVFGRLDPIPSRREVSGPGGGPIRQIGAVATASVEKDDAAAAYMALLLGDGEEEDDDAE